MKVTRGTGVALWRQIQERLESEIAGGELRPGSRCPTEHALAARFAVNRHTVRRAIAAMEEKGLLRVEQGRGTFVRERLIAYPVRKRTRFSENMAQQSRSPGGRLVHAATVSCNTATADALRLVPGAPVILVRTLGEVDGQPVSLADHFFTAARFPGIADVYRETHSVSRSLERYGVADYFRKVTRVTARMPERSEARHLQQPPNRPLMVTESINVDANGHPVEYGIARFAGDRVQLVFEP